MNVLKYLGVFLLGFFCFWFGNLFGDDIIRIAKFLPSYIASSLNIRKYANTGSVSAFERGIYDESASYMREDPAQRAASANYSNSGRVTVVEQGSTPAEPVIGTMSSPFSGIEYELNEVIPLESGDIKVVWKVHNLTDRSIPLRGMMKELLKATRLAVVDFQYDRRFSVKYDNFLPLANCLLSDRIMPRGRINCSAIVGNQYENLPGLEGKRVSVYFPGMPRTPLKVFLI